MYLGIEKLVSQLQTLQNDSVYYIATSSRDIALNTAVSCLYHNSKTNYKRYFAISDFDKEEVLSLGFPTDYLLKIDAQVLASKNKHNFLNTLIKDFRFLKATQDHSLFVIVFDEIAFLPFEDKNLDKLLSSFSIFASRFSSTLLFISFGDAPEQALTKISRKSHYLCGIGSITDTPSGIQLNTRMWRNDDGTFSQGINPIILTKSGYELVVDDYNTHMFVDHGLCYVNESSFAPDESLFRSIKYFSTNTELFNSAMLNAKTATLFFSLTCRNEIDTLGEYIYKLREKCGIYLKIIVVEKIPGIRINSRNFLLMCGANFIFEATAKSSYINAMMPALMDIVYRRTIYTPFENILESYHLFANEGNGYLSAKDFKDKISSLLAGNINNSKISAALAILTPNDSLSTETCISQFKPKRGGDYCTSIGGKLVIFLPMCTREQLSVTLEHTFNCDPSELFKSSDCFFNHHEIMDNILNLNIDSEEILDSKVIEHILFTRKTPDDEMMEDPKTVRAEPFDIEALK